MVIRAAGMGRVLLSGDRGGGRGSESLALTEADAAASAAAAAADSVARAVRLSDSDGGDATNMPP